MMLVIEFPHDYPTNIPFMQLRNLSKDYLDNTMLDEFETQIRAMAHENVGTQMMFEICEHLREQIADINDKVLGKYNAILDKKRAEEEEQNAPRLANVDEDLGYTPVTEETFSEWCKDFMAKLKQEEEASATDQDKRLTGKECFLAN